ncbi:MAG: glycoside hydrolase family 2 TIM barrel-domain containing protein [Chryseolinea sp.]
MIKHITILLVLGLVQFGCEQADDSASIRTQAAVRVVKINGQYQLLKNGKHVFVKGALGHSHLDYLKEIGGNTINVYHQYLTKEIFDQADSLGLYVAVTLNLARPFQGADYSDTLFLNAQRHMVDSIVSAYKDEPSLLFWIIGNEMHLKLFRADDLWREVNSISKRIHQLDPDHPTTTNIAAFERKQLIQVKYLCNDIDFISFNAHHMNYVLKRETRNLLWGWDGPYLITEWTGPVYWHEMQSTSWGAPVEPSSTMKADVMAHNYYIAIKRDSANCLGGFVFYWGQKQERTHTMFSLFLDDHYKTQAFEVLRYFWQGSKPKNYAPRINKFEIEDEKNPNAVHLRQRSLYNLTLIAKDPDGDSLRTKIEVYREGEYTNIVGGDNEIRPQLVSTQTLKGEPDRIPYTSPDSEGTYRIFVYVYDKENVATANIPFYVLPL